MEQDINVLAYMEKEYLKLSDEIKQLNVRLNSLSNAIIEYKKSQGLILNDIPIIKHDINNVATFPDYPMTGSLLEKINFIQENVIQKWWKKKEMIKQIKKIEGPNTKSLNAQQKRFEEMIEQGALIMVRYSNSNILTFYSTNREWIETNTSNILEPTKPHYHLSMKKLTTQQLQNPEWYGIK